MILLVSYTVFECPWPWRILKSIIFRHFSQDISLMSFVELDSHTRGFSFSFFMEKMLSFENLYLSCP